MSSASNYYPFQALPSPTAAFETTSCSCAGWEMKSMKCESNEN